MHKILWVGTILFLSSVCSPHLSFLPERHSSVYASAEEEGLFLPVLPELEQLSPQEAASIQTESSPSLSDHPTEEQFGWKIDLPVSEEAFEDFSLEKFPAEGPKKPREFDIPIVINARVEQFIQYFQTTGKKILSNWLARS